MKELTCFTFRDLSKAGGGSIRITGILNALAQNGINITLYSITEKALGLNNQIIIKTIPKSLTPNKRIFQFLIAFGLDFIYKHKLKEFKKLLPKKEILFFEYLDISIGFWLKKNKVIDDYITDVHGIAPMEFDLQETKSMLMPLSNKIKKTTAKKLDKKVFTNAKKIIYPSKGVKQYIENAYQIDAEKGLIVPEAINPLLNQQEVDKAIIKDFSSKYNLHEADKVILFAGEFKPLGGILDLIKSFILFKNEYETNCKLLLIGDGKLMPEAKLLSQQSKHDEDIVFIGRTPYNLLRTYQSLADIIICPDKDTVYSHLLPHIKYFESISSGKIVINGEFDCLQEINDNQFYSLNFKPSNVVSLKDTILYAVSDFNKIKHKYLNSAAIAKTLFSYNESISELKVYLNNG